MGSARAAATRRCIAPRSCDSGVIQRGNAVLWCPGALHAQPGTTPFQGAATTLPRFVSYWDFDSRSCNLEAVERDIGAMSHGEQIMLRFFVAVWCGENGPFDFIDAARSLEDPDRQVIIDWLTNPVLP